MGRAVDRALTFVSLLRAVPSFLWDLVRRHHREM
jgi:hypothetical protein